MSPPSCATAGRTRVSISSRICATISASGGVVLHLVGGDVMPAALPGRNSGRAAGEMVEQTSSTCGFSSRHSTPGRRRHRDEVAPEEHAPRHRRREDRGGQRRGLGFLIGAKSRVPASITCGPGMNLRVAGLGVVSVWISMGAMWVYCLA
jgi:hypothetical protein